jgi:hypothetical protein
MINQDTHEENNSTELIGASEMEDIHQALAALPLPMRSTTDDVNTPNQNKNLQSQNTGTGSTMNLLPSIVVLVCADFDLKSTSALAEYTLQQRNEIFDANSIDLIIAVGPSTGDTEMLNYYQGRKRVKHQYNHKTKGSAYRRSSMGLHHMDHLYEKDMDVQSSHTDLHNGTAPFFRSQEESAALEGLMTAALSQLESIVCRVVYCPGWQDPISIIQPSSNVKRLTPNSRNVHQQFLPIAPGLGCSGLLYIDHTDQLIEQYKMNQCETDSNSNRAQYHTHNNTDDDYDSEGSDQGDGSAMLSDQVKRLKQW